MVDRAIATFDVRETFVDASRGALHGAGQGAVGIVSLLGDIDDAGTSLSTVLSGYLTPSFVVNSEEGERQAVCASTTVDGEELLVETIHGELIACR